jgi:hypothetical protein
LATASLKKLAEEEREKYLRTTTVLSQGFFMYHVLSGCHDVTEAIKLQADLMALLVWVSI